MRNILFIIMLCTLLFADSGGNLILNITEEDGSPSTYPYRLKFTNGSVTNNGDSTTSVAVLTPSAAALTYLKLDQTTPQTIINGMPTVQGFVYNNSPTVGTTTPGKTYFDSTYKTLDIQTSLYTTLQVGQENITRVIAGENIANGDVVYFSGASGVFPLAMKAKADADATSRVKGISTQAITNGQEGFITNFGIVNDLNTNSFTVGDILYLSGTTAGAMQNTIPTPPLQQIAIGRVLVKNATTGSIYIGGHPNYPLSPDQVDLHRANSSTTYHTLTDWFNTDSCGQITGGTITDAGSQKIAVSAGTGQIAIGTSANDPIVFCDWAALSATTVTDARVTWVCVSYNSGSPTVVLYTGSSATDYSEPAAINYQDVFPLGYVVREGTTLHITNNPRRIQDCKGGLIRRFHQTRPLERDERVGGLILSETGTRNIAVSSGYLWERQNRFTINAFNSSGASRFTAYYRDGGTGFTAVTSQSQWPNTQYDNGTGTLATMTANRYANLWWYLESDGDLAMLYGRFEYTTAAAAAAGPVPSTLPLRLWVDGKLIARTTFKKSDSTFTAVDTVFTNTFQPSAASSHNNLSGLQGGTTGEYYHITSAQNTVVGNTSGTNTGDNTYSNGLTETVKAVANDLITGKSGGQTVIGGTAASNKLILSSTSNATKGGIEVGTNTTGEKLTVLATLGSELAPALTGNSGVNWAVGTGWTSPLAGTLEKAIDGTGTVTPVTFSPVSGTNYKVTIVVASISGSTLVVTGGGITMNTITTAGTYVDYMSAVSTTTLRLSPSGTALRCVISSVSIKAIPASPNTSGNAIVEGDTTLNGYVAINGYVGIGLLPTSTYRLNVNGSVKIPSGAAFGADFANARSNVAFNDNTIAQVIAFSGYSTSGAATNKTQFYFDGKTINGNASSGVWYIHNTAYTINFTAAQTGTINGIFLNATETALNGITHNLIDLQTGSVSKFKVNNAGNITINGDTEKSLTVNRHLTSNTAGNNLTIQSGGATSGATDKDSGALILANGLSTGTGKSSTKIQRLSRAASTGTTDNTLSDALIIPSEFNLTDASANSLFECALATLGMVGGTINFTILATDGTDMQVYTGVAIFAAVNKGGTYTTSIIESTSTNVCSTGTLSNTWSILEDTNKIIIQVTPNSSLTTTSLKIKYTITNYSGATLTQL